jgi:hypothetical protein
MEEYGAARQAFRAAAPSCSHTFCRECLTGLLDSETLFVRCPLCRARWPTSFGGIQFPPDVRRDPELRERRISPRVFPRTFVNGLFARTNVNVQVFTQGDLLAIYTLQVGGAAWDLLHIGRWRPPR